MKSLQAHADNLSPAVLSVTKRKLFIFLCILIIFSILVIYRAANTNTYWLANQTSCVQLLLM